MKRSENALPRKVVCPIPLANSETLFAAGAWYNALEFIFQSFALCSKKNVSRGITVTFRDLYFSKFYLKNQFAFGRAQKEFEKVGTAEYSLNEHDDRNDEGALAINISGFKFGIYEYHESICLAVGEAVGTDGHEIKSGIFRKKSVEWKTDVDTFLKVVFAIERALLGQGDPFIMRAFLTVRLEKARINVAIFHEHLPDGMELRMAQRSTAASSDYVRNIGKVPLPRCEILFT